MAYYGFTAPADNMTRTFFGGGPNFVIAAVFWAAVGLALSWLLRNRSVLVTSAAALPVSFIAAWLTLLALGLADIGIYLDGP